MSKRSRIHKQPRPRKPCCPRCKHPDFTRGVSLMGRPEFTCAKCGNTWTCGKTGGEYTTAARTLGSKEGAP